MPHRLTEITDWPNCPLWLRALVVEFLETMWRIGGIYKPATEILANLLQDSGKRRIVDLCSGGGGPLLSLLEPIDQRMQVPVEVVLTDLHPRSEILEPVAQRNPQQLSWWPNPVDATRPPELPEGIYTIFEGLHHLEKAQVRELLEHCKTTHRTIAAFEISTKTLHNVLGLPFIPLAVLAFTPWIRPFSVRRLLLTYLVPIAPLAVLWEGAISIWRSHSFRSLQAMANRHSTDQYQFSVKRVFRMGTAMVVLTGQSTERSDAF